jgi:hypothetical protein
MFPTAVEVDILNATIANLVAIRKLANQTFSAGASATSEGLKTAADWLIGKKLAEIYERHFTSKPRGVSYRSGRKQPGGPSIDFTLGVLQIMGVTNYHGHPYQAAGIVEIWKRT